eukprot:4329359-Prymnesium_polylepis.2
MVPAGQLTGPGLPVKQNAPRGPAAIGCLLSDRPFRAVEPLLTNICTLWPRLMRSHIGCTVDSGRTGEGEVAVDATRSERCTVCSVVDEDPVRQRGGKLIAEAPAIELPVQCKDVDA